MLHKLQDVIGNCEGVNFLVNYCHRSIENRMALEEYDELDRLNLLELVRITAAYVAIPSPSLDVE